MVFIYILYVQKLLVFFISILFVVFPQRFKKALSKSNVRNSEVLKTFPTLGVRVFLYLVPKPDVNVMKPITELKGKKTN